MEGKNIALLVTGSIAAYKSAELVREIRKMRATVQVVMTESAMEFITPLTLQSLSGSRVALDMFDPEDEEQIGHIKIAEQADVVLVAPATANCIAKIAFGLADDLLTTVALASKAPLVIAPAMNVNMWENDVTRRNVEMLRERGAIIVDPVEGELACGWVGKGRLAPLEQILDAVARAVKPQDLAGAEVLVTAGPTRESIDPIRYISNRSSGKMGYALAREAGLRGAKVTLITGPTATKRPYGVDVVEVVTANEMSEAVKCKLAELEKDPPSQVFVFKSAAVCDHRPEKELERKGKGNKGKPISLPLVANPDILSDLGAARDEFAEKTGVPLVLVGFAAETGTDEELEESAKDKLSRKNCDMIVANLADDSFGRETTRVFLADRNGRWLGYKEATKKTVARQIINHARSLVYDAKPGSRREHH